MSATSGQQERYALSFTSGGLLVRETQVVASIYLSCFDWPATRALVVDKNLLQSRTRTSSARLTRETIQRLSVLSDSEVVFLTKASPTEQRHLLWAAVCRRYDLIGEFAEEVLRERFLVLTPTLSVDDYERFISAKRLWHPELDEIKPSTGRELRRTLFRMLKEAGLRSEEGAIVLAVLSERVYEALASRDPSDIRFFPTTLPMEATR